MRETRYRFHGRQNPANKTRTAVLPRAELMGVEGDTAGQVKLYLYDPIDSWGGYWGVSAREFVQALAELPDTTNEIRLHINSPGGEVYEAIAINNALKNHPARVVAVVDGLAASAASFIAAGADETVMGQNTELMIHDAWGIAIGPAEDMRYMADRLDGLSNNIAGMYQRKAGGTVDDWRATMVAEKWYSADEAVAAGLADRVEGDQADDAAQARARFDLEGMFGSKAAGRGGKVPEPDYTPPPLPAEPARELVPAAARSAVPAPGEPVDETLTLTAAEFAARFGARQQRMSGRP